MSCTVGAWGSRSRSAASFKAGKTLSRSLMPRPEAPWSAFTFGINCSEPAGEANSSSAASSGSLPHTAFTSMSSGLMVSRRACTSACMVPAMVMTLELAQARKRSAVSWSGCSPPSMPFASLHTIWKSPRKSASLSVALAGPACHAARACSHSTIFANTGRAEATLLSSDATWPIAASGVKRSRIWATPALRSSSSSALLMSSDCRTTKAALPWSTDPSSKTTAEN
eukprot:1132286-Lingulodinium_polyedra.AAC.1